MPETLRTLTEIQSARKEILQPTIPLGIVGAAGPTGELFGETLAALRPVGVRKPGQTVNEYVFEDTVDSVPDLLRMRPRFVILAIPHQQVRPVLSEIAAYRLSQDQYDRPEAVILSSNGLLEEEIAEFERRLPLVRALLYTSVSRENSDVLQYRTDKLRIALAGAYRVEETTLTELGSHFQQAGFNVNRALSYKGAERAKLAANAMAGSAGAVLGVPNHRVYRDRQIAPYELTAFPQRIAALTRDGQRLEAPPWFNVSLIDRAYGLARTPFMGHLFRNVIARQMERQRGNNPPGAWKKIERHKPTELETYFGLFAQAGVLIDKAALQLFRLHQSGRVNLTNLTPAQRTWYLVHTLHDLDVDRSDDS